MSFWKPDTLGELKYFAQSLKDAEKIELFGQFLRTIGFRFWPDHSKLSELKYKFSRNNDSNSEYDHYFHHRKNEHEDRKPSRCLTTIYCLTYSYHQSSRFKEEFNGGFVVLLDKLNFGEERNSELVFKLYLHEHDDYVGYESKRFISKIQPYLTRSGSTFYNTLSVRRIFYCRG